MTEYIIILLLLIYGAYKELTIKGYKNKVLFYLLFIVMWLYSGLRYRVGTDSFMYANIFDYFPSIDALNIKNIFNYNMEPLWILYNSILKYICDDFIIVQLVSSFILNLAVFKFIKHNSNYIFLTLTLYFFIDYLLMNFEFMRQTTALGFYYLFVHNLYEKRKIKFWVFGIILLTFMHNTIIFCSLIPIIQKIKFSKKIILIVLSICAFIVLSNQVFNIISYFVPTSLSATEKIRAYQNDVLTIYSFNFFIVKFYTFFIVLFCILYDKSSKYMGVMLLYLIILALTATHDIFDRLHYCLFLFYYIVFSEVIVKILERTPKVLFLFLLFLINIPQIIYLNHNYEGNLYVYNKFFPYYSYLNPNICHEREMMNKGEEQMNFIFK